MFVIYFILVKRDCVHLLVFFWSVVVVSSILCFLVVSSFRSRRVKTSFTICGVCCEEEVFTQVTDFRFLLLFLSHIPDPVPYFHASDHVPEPRVPDQPLRRAAVSADARLQIHQIPGDEDAGTCEFGVRGLGKES